MEKHELRNEQPAVEERKMELLCYGVFAGYEGDKGYYSTAWVPLEDVLMSITRETMIAKLSSFRDGLARAIDAALLVPPGQTPGQTPPVAEQPTTPPTFSPETPA